MNSLRKSVAGMSGNALFRGAWQYISAWWRKARTKSETCFLTRTGALMYHAPRIKAGKSMRVISFCADGIREAAGKGFYDWAIDQDADIICVQDLRAPESALGATKYNPDGYFSYFFDAIDGSTNGVAIYCRKLPKAIMTGLGLGEADGEGRFMQADFENVSVACAATGANDRLAAIE